MFSNYVRWTDIEDIEDNIKHLSLYMVFVFEKTILRVKYIRIIFCESDELTRNTVSKCKNLDTICLEKCGISNYSIIKSGKNVFAYLEDFLNMSVPLLWMRYNHLPLDYWIVTVATRILRFPMRNQ